MVIRVVQPEEVYPPPAKPEETSWQEVLAQAIRDPRELCQLLGLPLQLAEEAMPASHGFSMLIPRTYLARIRPGDLHDPLLAQVLPRKEEFSEVAGFATDPLGEAAATCGPSLLRKYRRRLLILASGACGVHCRFCFRRHQRNVIEDVGRTPSCHKGGIDAETSRWDSSLVPLYPAPPDQIALEKVVAEEMIDEVILSGGDPLALPDTDLAQLARQLAKIDHLHRLRVHTRLPILIPQRVNEKLLDWLRGTRLATTMVIHVNHSAEIDVAVAAALGRLVDAGVPVLSQSVLLRGVNDNADVLTELFGRLVDLRVMPYYLHQLDRVAGAAHFEVSVERGVELVRELRARLPGYAVPRYVRDVPGESNKVVLA